MDTDSNECGQKHSDDDTACPTVKLEKGNDSSYDVDAKSVSPATESASTTVVNSKMNSSNIADVIGGSQTRRYLNANVTPYLLAGMRIIATEQPEDPLRRLGEYLIEQSELQRQSSKDNQ